MFIRIKKIKERPYAYLVANTWTSTGPRQKVFKYLGKIVKLEANPGMSFEDYLKKVYNKDLVQYYSDIKYRQLAMDMISFELFLHGFKKESNRLNNDSYTVDLNSNEVYLVSNRSPAVFQMNEGFLCNTSLRKFLNFKPKEGKYDAEIGKDLAERSVAAGLNINKEAFIVLYEKAIKDSCVI